MNKAALSHAITRNIVFVSGKGGVGKTTVSQALAAFLADGGKKTLWVAFEDPFLPSGEVIQKRRNLSWLNCKATTAFQEYVGLKIGIPSLTKLFLKNSLIRYMAEAAPGIHELVLLGKIWHERKNYDHVICDMPSTGYGLAMFHSTRNFARLFRGGPIHRDAEEMMETFSDATLSGHLIVSLPEEMPLRESIELRDFIFELFPKNAPAFLVNRCLPVDLATDDLPRPDEWPSPVPSGPIDYLKKRRRLETHNLRLWESAGIQYESLPYLPPPLDETTDAITALLARRFAEWGWR